MSRALPALASRLGVVFPSDAVTDGVAEREANIQATLRSRPDVKLRETDGSSISISGGERPTIAGGTEATASLTVYPSDGTGRLAISAVAPGAHQVARGVSTGACEVWVRDHADPRGGGVVRLVAAMCPAGMFELIAASPDGTPPIDPGGVAETADAILGR